MELQVLGGSAMSVSDDVFGREFKEHLVHQVVTAYRNAGRAGTKAQKSRSDLSGTTKKFKKQKGGGARHGDYRAPIFVGGGVTFAARPRSFAQKVNRTMYRSAMRSMLSELNRLGRLKIVADFSVQDHKTKSFLAEMKRVGVENGLFVGEDFSDKLFLASRNVPHVKVVDVHGMNPLDLVRSKSVIVTASAVKKIEEWLA